MNTNTTLKQQLKIHQDNELHKAKIKERLLIPMSSIFFALKNKLKKVKNRTDSMLLSLFNLKS